MPNYPKQELYPDRQRELAPVSYFSEIFPFHIRHLRDTSWLLLSVASCSRVVADDMESSGGMIPCSASLEVGICIRHQRFYVKAAAYISGPKKLPNSIPSKYLQV